ncbi:unnamed protein product [Allacma fusca]|uniref:O-acyltransferase WSD1 C-terminal domain-containing protein n=1 Tax=Allacma fusca TaxID=39272 RepID=A0A8J2LPW8_9HEXA|nr:unnamed protein product [Allacma fusca]
MNLKLLIRPVIVTIAGVIAGFGMILLFALTALIFPYRCIVWVCAKIFRPDLCGFITGLTSVFMLDTPEKPSLNLLSYKIIHGRVSLEQFRSLVTERVINKKSEDGQGIYSRLQQTYTNFMGYAFWQWDKDFKIENHVRIYDYGLKHPKMQFGNVCVEEDLRRIMGDFLSAPWTKNQSPWEFLLIYNFKTEEDHGTEKMVFVSRFHHGIGDGHSSAQLLQDMGLDYKPSAVPSYPKKSVCFRIFFFFIFPFKLCYDLADNFTRSLDINTAWHPRNVELSKTYYTSFTKPIPVSLVKEIKQKYQVSYLAVLYAATSGGIQRVMEEAGQKIPEKMACFNPVPKPNHPPGMVNHMMWIFTTLPIKQRSVVIRLKEIQKDLMDLRSSLTPIASDLIVGMFGLMPKNCRHLIKHLINSAVMASNFPVPPDAPVFQDCPVPDVIFGCGTSEVRCGANVFMIGLGGMQRIVVNIDKSVFPSEEIFKKLGTYIEEDFYNLLYGVSEDTENANNVV